MKVYFIKKVCCICFKMITDLRSLLGFVILLDIKDVRAIKTYGRWVHSSFLGHMKSWDRI